MTEGEGRGEARKREISHPGAAGFEMTGWRVAREGTGKSACATRRARCGDAPTRARAGETAALQNGEGRVLDGGVVRTAG